jgi:hypothetical protein
MVGIQKTQPSLCIFSQTQSPEKFYGKFTDKKEFVKKFISDLEGNEGWNVAPELVIDYEQTAHAILEKWMDYVSYSDGSMSVYYND